MTDMDTIIAALEDAQRVIPELKAEIERLRNDIHSCHPGCTRAGCVNERLRTLADDRLQQMQADRQQALRWRADAERYRWLRDTPWQDELRFTILHQKNALWDAAIDAAMKETP